jgi:hypothetical protein
MGTKAMPTPRTKKKKERGYLKKKGSGAEYIKTEMIMEIPREANCLIVMSPISLNR